MRHDSRRQARILAFVCQYQRLKLGSLTADPLLLEQPNLPAKTTEFARSLVDQAQQKQSEIDRLIQAHSQGWKQSRLLDLLNALLQISVAELIQYPQTNSKVILNEFIEICRSYIGERSIKLFNGIMHAIANELRPS